MVIVSQPGATLDDLAREPGKAELIGGTIIRISPTGHKPNRVASRILRGLDDYAEATGQGEAYTDDVGFAVPILPSGRQSLSPDVSYFAGPLTSPPMRFIDGPPTFAVEVRGEGDYGPRADAENAAKREDYFAAGTLVVWDVDTLGGLVHVYRRSDPLQPATFKLGQTAEAEPAVPGWKIAVDRIFA